MVFSFGIAPLLPMLVTGLSSGIIRREYDGATRDPRAAPVEGTFSEDAPACTGKDLKLFWKRFKIGPKYGKDCVGYSEDKLPEGKLIMPWEHDLQYVHPDHPNDVALYLYPEDDHNGAFSLCEIDDEGEFETTMCKRLLAASERYSVKFTRVSNTAAGEEAVEAAMRALGKDARIHRLVLGGHGQPHKLTWTEEDDDEESEASEASDDEASEAFELLWGEEEVDDDDDDDDEASEDSEDFSEADERAISGRLDFKHEVEATVSFLEVARGYLTDDAIVFCDSCLGGKCMLDEMNFVQYVALFLSGHEVCGSQLQLDQFMLDLYKDEHARPRLAVHSHPAGLERRTCALFPRGMDTWGHKYAHTCAKQQARSRGAEHVSCALDVEGARSRAECEAQEIAACRDLCEERSWCEAFVYHDTKSKRKTNCELVRDCQLASKRHAQVFTRSGV